jgi:SAM-dependent methyltransferase
MHLIKRLNKSLKQKGALETLKSGVRILADYRFDLKYGTDTMHRVDVDSFDTDSNYKIHATPYQATKTRPLLKLFRKLRLPQDGTFVDIGCGKGRVLFVAAQFGFKKIVGIEFCAVLCRRARENADRFIKKRHSGSSIEIIETDIIQYDFTGDEAIFFLYNPFDSVVLAKVLKKIDISVLKRPRDIWLIYNNPLHHDIVLNNGPFTSFRRYIIDGELFHVYERRISTGE